MVQKGDNSSKDCFIEKHLFIFFFQNFFLPNSLMSTYNTAAHMYAKLQTYFRAFIETVASVLY